MTLVLEPTPGARLLVVPALRPALRPAPEIWIHARASIASRLLGGRAAVALGADPRAVRRAALAELDPDRPGHAAALVEAGAGRAEEIAGTLGRALGVRPRPAAAAFDVWHEVPLVQQLTGMSCWAAAAAMVVGWRDCTSLEAKDVAAGGGHWEAYRAGLEPREVESFARAWGLRVAHPGDLGVTALRALLESHGPLWVGEASPSLHVVVLAGMYGDGTPEGTFVRIADPWPIGRGERYTIPFSQFRQNLMNAAALAGGRPQFLYAAPSPCRARARGPAPRPAAAWR